MFAFNYAEGATLGSVWLVWGVVFVSLFLLNEVLRRNKWIGFTGFIVVPIILSILLFTVLSEST